MGLDVDDMISVVLTKEQHSGLTKLWREAVEYIGNYSNFEHWSDIREIAKKYMPITRNCLCCWTDI